MTLTSAAGLLSFLDENDRSIQSLAVAQLLVVVDVFWAEVADYLPKLYRALTEERRFMLRRPSPNAPALPSSFQRPVLLIEGGSPLTKVYFHLGAYQEAVNYALLAADKFPLFSHNEFVETITAKFIDSYIASPNSKLEAVVSRIFFHALENRDSKQALGLSLETHRIDWVAATLEKASSDPTLLCYTMNTALGIPNNIEFRSKVLALLLQLLQKQPKPDYLLICECCIYLEDCESAASVLKMLVEHGQALPAYQICFNLNDNASQRFCTRVISLLQQLGVGEFEKLKSILDGTMISSLHLAFLSLNNHSDMMILSTAKQALNAKNSLHHSAISFANSLMNAGTTNDEFLRKNMEWLGYASNWSKFTATAALGLIHQGHINKAFEVLKPYLPQDGVTSSPYSEGGALFALGLINANHGQSVVEHLKKAMLSSQQEPVQHGAAFGLGVASLGSCDSAIFESLKTVLYSDNAVSGEAAGIALGLCMAGSGPQHVEELLQYAHKTQHEKIIRGLAIGISLMMYGQQDKADVTIEQLVGDKDPLLRYGGAFSIGLAYCGTENNAAIRKLLHIAVSDTSDEVRRAAVMCIGFLLYTAPTRLPEMLRLLTQSYNPHVRYGAAMALGIGCAGTGMSEALDLLEPMKSDLSDFVRQAVMVAEAMILIQENSPVCEKKRAYFEKVATNKHEDPLARFGAILAEGIIDAGGRNVTISLQTTSGHSSMPAVIGTALFCQFWYWHPTILFLGSALQPTGLICLDSSLRPPVFRAVPEIMCPYPPPRQPTVTAAPGKTTTAILSTTAKALARAKKHEKEKAGMDVEPAPKPAEMMMVVESPEPEKTPAAAAPPPPPPVVKEVKNFERILAKQIPGLVFDSRFSPLVPLRKSGIAIVVNHSSETVEYVKIEPERAEAEREPSPPKPFEYSESK